MLQILIPQNVYYTQLRHYLCMPLSQTSTGSLSPPLTHLSATSGNNNETDGERGGTTEMLPRTSISPSAHYQPSMHLQQHQHSDSLLSQESEESGSSPTLRRLENFDRFQPQNRFAFPLRSKKIFKSDKLPPQKRCRRKMISTRKRIEDRLRGRMSLQYQNKRKNIPRKSSIFFPTILKNIELEDQKVLKSENKNAHFYQRLKEFRDRPVYLQLCFLYLQDHYTPTVQDELMKIYFQWLDKRKNEQEGILAQLPDQSPDQVSCQVIKDYGLARQAYRLFAQGKWLDSIKRFFGVGKKKENLIDNIGIFLQELKHVFYIEEAIIPSRQQLQGMILSNVELILRNLEPHHSKEEQIQRRQFLQESLPIEEENVKDQSDLKVNVYEKIDSHPSEPKQWLQDISFSEKDQAVQIQERLQQMAIVDNSGINAEDQPFFNREIKPIPLEYYRRDDDNEWWPLFEGNSQDLEE